MNPAAKNKSLVLIIIFLLIANIVMLIFFLVLNKPVQRNTHSKDQRGMSGMLQKEVGFSQDQVNAYQSLRQQQLDTVHAMFEQVRKAKIDFYEMIYTLQASDSAVNNAADVIAQRQKTLDLYMFNHFKMVRNICKPDQLPKFDSTIKKVIVRMTGKAGHDQKK